MRVGIVVTDARQGELAQALFEQALQAGHSVRCFLTENGVNLVKEPGFVALAAHAQAHLSLCEHSVERYCADFDLASVADQVIVGGQYQNAELVRNSDQLLCL